MTIAAAVSQFSENCHPERSLPVSEANCQTESKDPYCLTTAGAEAGNFLIITCFFDEQHGQLVRVCSREATPWEALKRQCQGSKRIETTKNAPRGASRHP
jgi:hypothetical protein